MSSTVQTVGTGRIGGHDPFVEGTPESRQAAHKEQVRELRLEVARRRFFEVPAEHLETRRVGRVRYVVDTRSRGLVYEHLGVEVFARGDHHIAFNEDAVAAFTVVDGQVVFLKHNGAGIANLERLEQYEAELAYLAGRKLEKTAVPAGGSSVADARGAPANALLVPPLLLAGLEILHPQPDETVQALMDASTWFAGFHVIQLALTGMVGMSVLLLADSFGYATAWSTRIGIGVFLVFFSAYDTLAGIGTGLAMRSARDLSPIQQEGVFEVVKNWPAVGSPFALGIIGSEPRGGPSRGAQLGWVFLGQLPPSLPMGPLLPPVLLGRLGHVSARSATYIAHAV